MRKKSSSVLSAVVFLLATSFAAEPVTVSVTDQRMRDYLSATSANEFEVRWRKLFESVSGDKGAELLGNDNAGIAVQAAWEEVLQVHAPKGPTTQPESSLQPRREDLNWFVGFCEGRLRCRLPSPLSDVIKGIEVYERSTVIPIDKCPPFVKTATGWFVPRNLQIVDDQKSHMTVEIDKKRFRISKESMSSYNSPMCVNVAAVDEVLYVAIHDPIGFDYKLCCLKQDGNAEVWCSKVAAAGKFNAWYTGWRHWTAIQCTNDVVYIFGVCEAGIYMEGFNQKTGVRLLRFFAP